jgi:hypothetical protein
MAVWMGSRRQAKYGKLFGGFMKDQDRFVKLRLRCLRGNLVDL